MVIIGTTFSHKYSASLMDINPLVCYNEIQGRRQHRVMMMKAITGAFVMKYKACIYRRDHKFRQQMFIHIGPILDGKTLDLIFNREHRSRGTTFHFLSVIYLVPFACLNYIDMFRLAQTLKNLYKLAQTCTDSYRYGHLCE